MLQKTIICGREVAYDDEQFEVVEAVNIVDYVTPLDEQPDVCLHYIGDGKNIQNPKGNTVAVYMFQDCPLDSIDLSNFDGSEITLAYGMFLDANARNINFGNMNFSKVKNISSMFTGCCNLKSVKMGKVCMNPDVEDTSSLFHDCPKLEFVDFSCYTGRYLGEDFVTCCPALRWLDLSGLDFSDVSEKYMAQHKGRLCDFSEDSFNAVFGDYDGSIILSEGYLACFKAYYPDDAEKAYSQWEANILMGRYSVSKKDKIIITKIKEQAEKLIKYNKGMSTRTVGDIADLLYRRFSNRRVDRALIELLSDERITEE